MDSIEIKQHTLDLHKRLESVNPLSVQMMDVHGNHQYAIEAFKDGMKSLWFNVAYSPDCPHHFLGMRMVYDQLYGKPATLSIGGRISWWAQAYVLLGSSLGSAYILNTLRKNPNLNLTYFMLNAELAPLWKVYKMLLPKLELNVEDHQLLLKTAANSFQSLINLWGSDIKESKTSYPLAHEEQQTSTAGL